MEIRFQHAWHSNHKVYTINDGSRELFTIAFNGVGIADTLFTTISEISARTRIHSTYEHKFCGICATCIDTIDRDFPIFEWLSECFEKIGIKLKEFIEKQYSFVCE